MIFKWRGGIHPEDNKSHTNSKPIEKITPPEFIYLPMSMHIGAPCEPIVNIGDKVKIGQKVADSDSFMSAPIHSSVSGNVTEIKDMMTSQGRKVKTIVIKNDFANEYVEFKEYNYKKMTQKQITDAIKNAGIVGHGGAAFPTHVKISSAIDKIDTIIINAAECEPYITSDHRLLLEYPEKLISGILILEKLFGITNILIGIEKNKKNVFETIREEIRVQDCTAKLVPLPTRFPQGAEKQLIYSLTKRQVPSGKLPSDVSCVVFNVDTVIAINRVFETGAPMLRRVVTVSGSAIANPKNLEAPIGTPITHLVSEAGGFKDEPNKLILGGPMMGAAQFTTDIPVVKGTNAFLAFMGNEDKRTNNPSCIRCGRCTNVCPMKLAPIYMNLYAKKDKFDEYKKIGGLDCVFCGCCSYECPARIDLVQNFKATKDKIMMRK